MKFPGQLTINPNVQLFIIQFPSDMKFPVRLTINPNVQFFNIQFPFVIKFCGRNLQPSFDSSVNIAI